MAILPDHKQLTVKEFPFKTSFSLDILIQRWQNLNEAEVEIYGEEAARIEQWLKEYPQLTGKIDDFSILEKHSAVFGRLISPLFSKLSWTDELKILVPPFTARFVMVSSQLGKISDLKPENQKRINQQSLYQRILYAYRAILAKFYDLPLQGELPMVYAISQPDNGLDRYYKVQAISQFMELTALGPLPKLSNEDLNELINDHYNLNRWMELLPPENFEFSGCTVLNLVDVTSEEAMESLKRILLESIKITSARFQLLEKELQIYLQMPDVNLGIATLQGNGKLNFRSRRKIWNSLKPRSFAKIAKANYNASLYGKILKDSQIIMIKDLEKYSDPSPIEEELLKKGIRNLCLIPLVYHDELVGLLELTSKNPGDIDALSTIKINQILPIFALAVHQNRERFEHRVEDVIKDAYTAIHPTVAWRFREAAINMLDKQEKAGKDETVETESIVFNQVFPLYGAADIRGSSRERNQAIQQDLVEHLQMAKSLINASRQTAPLNILDELKYEVEKAVEQIKRRLNTGDETTLIEFLQDEVNPLLRHLQVAYPKLEKEIEQFFKATHSELGIVDHKRKSYEQSLNMINDTISRLLDQDQVQSQKIFPHYFEKYITDGVEHNLYVGASLARDQEFFPMYLKNLRLRQLILSCNIAREISRVQPDLPIPLTLTQLILVHSTPLSISFRLEENKFDVDGAYNIRYEIVKKRIDKALVKGTLERLTQPDKIVVIYSMDKEATEYLRYIDYLQSKGYLNNEIEHLEVDALQGVDGLKAIRVSVNLKGLSGDEDLEAEIHRIAEELSEK